MSRMVDVGNLPSHRGLKRAKVDSSSCGKAPLFESNPPPAENPVKVPPFLLKLPLVLIQSRSKPFLCLPFTLL